MLDEQKEITTASVFFGFLIGLVVTVGLLMLALGLGELLQANIVTGRHAWIYPLVNGALVAIAGVLALRKFNTNGIARGIVIALALAFMLNGLCGVVLR